MTEPTPAPPTFDPMSILGLPDAGALSIDLKVALFQGLITQFKAERYQHAVNLVAAAAAGIADTAGMVVQAKDGCERCTRLIGVYEATLVALNAPPQNQPPTTEDAPAIPDPELPPESHE